jgi:hypothetical protein
MGRGEIVMADDRLVPKSAGKMMGALALIGALAGAGTLLVWGCTDNSGSGKFVEPNRPFDAAATDSAAGSSSDASSDAAVDAAKDAVSPDAKADLGADR